MDTLLHLLGICGDSHTHFDLSDLFAQSTYTLQYYKDFLYITKFKYKTLWMN